MTDQINDERVAFYLRHQDLIETWAAVRDDARSLARRFYLSLGDDLEDVATELGNDVMVWRRDGKHSNVGLFRRDWYGKDEPLLVASLEVRDATFTDGWRVVGWRVDQHAEGGKDLRKLVGDLVRDSRAGRGFPDRNRWWPVRRDAPAPRGEYWRDLSTYRETLVMEIKQAWEAFSDEMSAAFASWASPG